MVIFLGKNVMYIIYYSVLAIIGLCIAIAVYTNKKYNFLCKIGFHDWEWVVDEKYKYPGARQICKNCKKMREY